MRSGDIKKTHSKITKEMKTYFKKAGFRKAVVGLSGGLDSAVTVKLAVDALGKQNVFAILMPEKGLTKNQNTKDAVDWAKKLGISYSIQPINTALKHLRKADWKPSSWAELNMKPRIRMIYLYSYANTKKALVLGTSNKSELLLGYGTKYGDLGSDIMPIGNIYKTDLIELAKYLKIPEKIIEKEPTAELMPCQTDANDLGATYAEIDPILKSRFDKKQSVSVLKKKFNPKLVNEILKRYEQNSHKGNFPYICKI
ncbi:MAG: NAD+ synthase [Candidatus Diapherotrites archaeon]